MGGSTGYGLTHHRYSNTCVGVSMDTVHVDFILRPCVLLLILFFY